MYTVYTYIPDVALDFLTVLYFNGQGRKKSVTITYIHMYIL